MTIVNVRCRNTILGHTDNEELLFYLDCSEELPTAENMISFVEKEFTFVTKQPDINFALDVILMGNNLHKYAEYIGAKVLEGIDVVVTSGDYYEDYEEG